MRAGRDLKEEEIEKVSLSGPPVDQSEFLSLYFLPSISEQAYGSIIGGGNGQRDCSSRGKSRCARKSLLFSSAVLSPPTGLSLADTFQPSLPTRPSFLFPSAMEFLHPDNAAGQSLLVLVSRGSSIIAEIFRLSEHIPSVFKGSPNDPAERARYSKILFDFSYLRNADQYDERLEQDPVSFSFPFPPSVPLLLCVCAHSHLLSHHTVPCSCDPVAHLFLLRPRQDAADLDEEFRENHLALLERFYKLFDSVYRYVSNFNTYLEDLSEGVFVQHTTESVLLDVEGKQLMAEALYLYGCMLLLLDIRIPGIVRERLIVSFYRYKGAAGIPTLDQVTKLMRRTGFNDNGEACGVNFMSGKNQVTSSASPVQEYIANYSHSHSHNLGTDGNGANNFKLQKRMSFPKHYPEEYFSRCPVSQSIVDMIIGRLRSDDIYNHTSAYPSPVHRSTALVTQAAMLFVNLYFAPQILHDRPSVMREIVDKHFSDQWMFPFYLGCIVDLSVAWEPFKAARSALKNVLTKKNATAVTQRQAETVPKLLAGLDRVLTEGVLIDEYVLENVQKLLNLVRNCNVTLRWFMIHRTTMHRQFQQLVQQAVPVQQITQLLFETAMFEYRLKSMFKRLLETKNQRWDECRREAADRMTELSEYFSGEKALTRVSKNQKLQEWFGQVAAEINSLDIGDSVVAGRKLASLISALESVEAFHQIEDSMQVKQFLLDTRGFLTKMIRTINVNDKVLGDLDIVSDFSYAWELINSFTGTMHSRIKQDPNVVLLLRATFLKLASILSLPLVRITQCGSKDAVSVADYYSNELVKYVRGVLDIVPKSVFKNLDEIINMQTHVMKPLPVKLERKYLRDYAQLEERHKLAKLTHQVSVFTQGVLAMNTTFIGIIKIDPKQLLEDGIRKELVRQITRSLHEYLTFGGSSGKGNRLQQFEDRMVALGRRLDGFRESFEYIQDYISVYGLKIWQEEVSRIINYSVEQESNQFLKRKVYDWQSQYQSDAIPIPRFPRVDAHSVNFMGRLIVELSHLTNPGSTVYVEARQGWYGQSSKDRDTEIVGIRTFSLLHRGVGVFGLTGLDKLCSFMIVRDLTSFVKLYHMTVVKGVARFLQRLREKLHPTSQFPANTEKLYSVAQQKTHKLWPAFLRYVTRIGQLQLIRRQVSNELQFSCKMDSKTLSCSLEALNDALLADIKIHYARPEERPYPENPTLPDVSQYLEHSGINNPLTKIYITNDGPLIGIPCLMFLFILDQVSRLHWDVERSTLVCTKPQKNQPLDGAPLIMGVVTVLKQFHSSYTHSFLAYLGQYVRSHISSAGGRPSGNSSDSRGVAAALPAQVRSVLLFLEEFCRFSYIDRKAIDSIIPSYIFDNFHHQ